MNRIITFELNNKYIIKTYKSIDDFREEYPDNRIVNIKYDFTCFPFKRLSFAPDYKINGRGDVIVYRDGRWVNVKKYTLKENGKDIVWINGSKYWVTSLIKKTHGNI